MPKYASCDDGMQKFDERSVFYEGPAYGNYSFTPQEGDIIFTGDIGDAGHTGIVAFLFQEKDEEGKIQTIVNIIDGNNNGGVRWSKYNI